MNSNSIKNSYCENMNAILDFFDKIAYGAKLVPLIACYLGTGCLMYNPFWKY